MTDAEPKVLTAEEEKWKAFKMKIAVWKRANKGWNDEDSPKYIEDLDSLDRLIKKGNSNSTRQARIMTTIRTLFMDVTTSPFKTGKASKIPIASQNAYNLSRATARTALIALWGSLFFQHYSVKSKRGGGGVFTSAEAFADYELESYDARVKSAMRGSSKDYSFVIGMPLTNLIEQKTVVEPVIETESTETAQ
jgi:hypothetical protein